MALIRRRDPSQRSANPRNLRVREGVLFIRYSNKRTPDGETVRSQALILPDSLWFSTCLSPTREAFLTTREELRFQTLSTTKNCCHIICLIETWLKEHISNTALLLPSYEVHRKDRPSDSGNKKHGGVLIAITKNTATNEVVSDSQDCIFNFLYLSSPSIPGRLYGAEKIVATHGRFIRSRNLSNSLD